MLISVACAMKFHSFYLAGQLQRHDVLKGLYTSYYGRFGHRQNNVDVTLPREKVHTNLIAAFLNYVYSPGGTLLRYDVFGKWVARNLSDEDIVISWGLSALPIIRRAHKLGMLTILERGSAHAAVQRDLLLEEYSNYGTKDAVDSLQKSFAPARMERELLEYELADYIEVPSSFALRSFIRQGIPEKKLIKGFRGVDLRQFVRLPKQDNIFRVVSAGAMSLQKGVHYLLQAFAELKLPKAELWLLGSKKPEIEPFFKRYEGSFQFLGHQPQAKLREYYSQCSVFAMCSVQEGLATVQLQGMACGLPLICTTNTGGDDLVEDGKEGFIVPIRDVEALKEKILYLYDHQDVCYEMGQAAERKVQQGFTWDDYGARIMNIYEHALGNVSG